MSENENVLKEEKQYLNDVIEYIEEQIATSNDHVAEQKKNLIVQTYFKEKLWQGKRTLPVFS